MSALTRFFFDPVYTRRSTWTIVNWWESRRAIYNLCVGAAGALSLLALGISAVVHPHPQPIHGPPVLAVVVYAVMANLCYSIGPALDVYIHRWWGPEYAPVGPALFRYGFVFSVGLTLLPIPLSVVSWLARLFF